MTRGIEAAVATEMIETEAEVAAVIETTEIAEIRTAAETEMTEAAAVATETTQETAAAETSLEIAVATEMTEAAAVATTHATAATGIKTAAETEMTEAAAVAIVTTHVTAAAEISLETAVAMAHETAAAETSLETAVAMGHETAVAMGHETAETNLETAVAMGHETVVGETTVMKMPPDPAVMAAVTVTRRMITRAATATPAVTETAGETTGTLDDEVNVMTVTDGEATEMTRDETVMIVERSRRPEDEAASATENDLTDEATDENRPDTISWLAISSAYFLTHPHISETLTQPPCVQSR